MRILTLVVCLMLAGCGSGGSGSTANNVMMQGGQWEYVSVPENGTIPMFIDVNLPGTNGTLSGTDAQIYQPSENGIPSQSGPLYCGAFNLNGSITDSTLSGKLSWGQPPFHFANFSGELAANGQSLSNGTYDGQVCLLTTGPGVAGPQVKGKFTGYTIAPVNGTFTGTLNSNLHGPDVVTLTITQNPDFSLIISGMSVENGVTTTLSAVPHNTAVVGATVFISGSADNVNGSGPFSVDGHLNPAATQLTITVMSLGPDENVTGALTKQ